MLEYYHTEVFPLNIAVATFDSIEEINKEGIIHNDGDTITKEQCDGRGACIQAKRVDEKGNVFRWTVILLSEDATIGTVAHEVFHCVQMWAEQLGISFVYGDNNETFAYLIEWLTNAIYKDFSVQLGFYTKSMNK